MILVRPFQLFTLCRISIHPIVYKVETFQGNYCNTIPIDTLTSFSPGLQYYDLTIFSGIWIPIMIPIPSYFHNGDSYASKTAYSFWNDIHSLSSLCIFICMRTGSFPHTRKSLASCARYFSPKIPIHFSHRRRLNTDSTLLHRIYV